MSMLGSRWARCRICFRSLRLMWDESKHQGSYAYGPRISRSGRYLPGKWVIRGCSDSCRLRWEGMRRRLGAEAAKEALCKLHRKRYQLLEAKKLCRILTGASSRRGSLMRLQLAAKQGAFNRRKTSNLLKTLETLWRQ